MVANAEAASADTGEAVDFILDTPITWTMVEKDMQKALNTEAKFGENKKAELIGQGNGFVSKIVATTLDWTEPNEDLPISVVLKITGFAKFQELMEKMTTDADAFGGKDKIAANTIRIHNNELAFYRLVNEEWKVNHKDLKLPVFYCGREWGVDGVDAGYFAIEHVENVVLRHMYHTIGSPAVIEAFEVIAKVHALSLKHKDSLKGFDDQLFMEMFADIFNEEKVRDGLPKVVDLLPDCKEEIEVMLDKLHVFTFDNYKKLIKDSCQPPVLCHGDMWTANMLWLEKEDGSETLRAIIDWQINHLGSPIEDFARFLGAATSWETKKKDIHLYFDKYYETFLAECGDDVRPPFTKEQLIENYEKFMPFVTVPCLAFFLPICDMILASAPDKETAKVVFLDKMRGMVHEAVDYIKKWY